MTRLKIITGGPTGVDRTALDVVLALPSTVRRGLSPPRRHGFRQPALFVLGQTDGIEPPALMPARHLRQARRLPGADPVQPRFQGFAGRASAGLRA